MFTLALEKGHRHQVLHLNRLPFSRTGRHEASGPSIAIECNTQGRETAVAHAAACDGNVHTIQLSYQKALRTTIPLDQNYSLAYKLFLPLILRLIICIRLGILVGAF